MDYFKIATNITRARAELVLAGSMGAAVDRLRECGPDVATMEDDGGGAHVLHDPAMRSDIQTQPALTILGLITYADPSTTLGEIVDMAREISELGVHVCCKPHRNERGIIDGFTLGRLVA